MILLLAEPTNARTRRITFFELWNGFPPPLRRTGEQNSGAEALATDEVPAVSYLNGRALVFKKDHQGTLSVIGIAVTKQQRSSDGTTL